MITVYLGDVGEYLSELCRSVDADATLITQHNFSNLAPGTYYTSLADLGTLPNLGSVLQQANTIVYAPPAVWSDQYSGHSGMRNWTEDYLNVFRFKCAVKNFDHAPQYNKEKILALADGRKTQQPQLWIVGCSVSHGDGVSTQDRYGQLLANRLDLNASFLTASGSSIVWAADQLLRSDLQPNDVVVWGLTAWSRTPYFKKNLLAHINVSSYNDYPAYRSLVDPDFLNSDQLFYQSLTSVFQVINHCRKVNATLILACLLDTVICDYISDQPGFLMLCNFWGRERGELFIDNGTDGLHPGVRTHQFYADQIHQKIQQLVAKNQ